MRRSVRVLRGELMATDIRDVRRLLDRFAHTIPLPPGELHRGALAADLLAVCSHIMRTLHDREDARACACAAVGWDRIARLAAWREIDPRLAFREYVDAFLACFESEHAAGVAQRAAWMIQSEPVRAWTLSAVAGELDVRPARLRRDFHRRYGMRLSAYVHLVRTAQTVSLLASTSKVEAVAREVGFRSKKDLYQVLARWVGATPTELRALSQDERAWLDWQLRIRWVHGLRSPVGDAMTPRITEIAGSRETPGTPSFPR